MAAENDDDTEREPEPSPARFDDPIEFIHTEHDHQLVMLGAIERLAADPAGADAIGTASHVLRYLEHELPLHIEDEEQDLFPALGARVEADDGFDEVLASLQHEHEADDAYCQALIVDIRRIAEGKVPENLIAFGHQARAFARFQRRHLAWENSVVLPLARKRLRETEIAGLRRRFAARRGIEVGE